MTDKITLGNFASFQNDSTAVALANSNNVLITTALNNTLSRDGTSPNQMGATLDMNSNQIINLPAPSTNQSPLRLADLPAGAVNPTFVGGTNITIGGTTISTIANPNFATRITTPQVVLNGSTISSAVGTGTAIPLYQAGTWTPTDGSGASLSLTISDANYILIGKLCTVMASITYPATGSGATAQINGLPFTTIAGGTRCNIGKVIGLSNCNVLVSFSATSFQFCQDNVAPVTNATLSTLILRLTFQYFTA